MEKVQWIIIRGWGNAAAAFLQVIMSFAARNSLPVQFLDRGEPKAKILEAEAGVDQSEAYPLLLVVSEDGNRILAHVWQPEALKLSELRRDHGAPTLPITNTPTRALR